MNQSEPMPEHIRKYLFEQTKRELDSMVFFLGSNLEDLSVKKSNWWASRISHLEQTMAAYAYLYRNNPSK